MNVPDKISNTRQSLDPVGVESRSVWGSLLSSSRFGFGLHEGGAHVTGSPFLGIGSL